MIKAKLSVLCLNCYGIPIPVHKKQRFKLIAEELYKLSPDIIALQEVFVWTNRNTIVNKLKHIYNIYPDKFLPFSSGGLVTFIKKGIKVNKFSFSKFIDKGNKTFVSIPEGIANKGYQIIDIKVNSKNIRFINCHLMCQYSRSQKLKKSYANQISQLINALSISNDNLILAGDLNDYPYSASIHQLRSQLKLNESLGLNDFTISLDNLNRGKITNIYSAKSFRTDYTLVSDKISIKNQLIVFDKYFYLGGKRYQLSDHYGILTELEI